MDISAKPEHKNPWGDEETPFLEIGGEEPIRLLVDRFYDEVEATSPVLTAMLPRDTTVTRRKLFEFLVGWMGGPQLYVENYGHPRLRMRHFPFKVDEEAAREWMRCMVTALDETLESEPLATFLAVQLASVASHMINS